MKSKFNVAVIGAGAFGGWTALRLLEAGARVTLLDGWGPGNSRASSGGETRVMRGTYGPNQPYTEMAAHAMQLWTKYERRWKRQFLHRTGVLWMAAPTDDAYERGSLKPMRQAKIPFQELSVATMKRRWPQINFEGIGWGIFEPESGYLDARASCQAVVDAFIAQDGNYRHVAALPQDLENAALRDLLLSDGSRIKADAYIFACGPWMGKLFPATIGAKVQATKQEIFFFGAPAGDARFNSENLPVWGDHRDHFFYGIPGSGRRGFKVADDTRGPAFDPTDGERTVSSELLRGVREYLAFRFPGLKDAPLIETRVCQYEETPDGNFILDRHPRAENVWLLGGGSGHGFKHGPAVGEMMAKLVLGKRQTEPLWELARFAKSKT